MYETFDHTADVGLRIRAESLPVLFAEAGRGLFSLIVANLDEVRPVQTVAIDVAGTDRDYLLFDWLNELLFQFDSQRFVFSSFDIRLGDQGLSAVAHGEPLDAARHRLEHEVKAITYHGLKVEETPGGWLAEVILDI